MLGLFRKTRKKVVSIPVRRVRLSLEALESRDCPSGSDIGGLSTPPASPPEQTPPTNMAPTLSLNIAYGQGRMVTLSGQVTDENPGGLTVCFSGVVDGFTVTNADGSFSVQLEASSLGLIEASTVDAQGLVSNTASVTVTSAAPQIVDASCTEGVDNIWTFSGRVIDESAEFLVVQFAGLTSVVNQTATVEADGTFTLIVTLQPNEEGTVTAITTDWWGQISNTAEYIVRQT